ncbi:hypothetical protein DSM112329_04225 [Paraconexibacter sp. AEG42_29]|uniref:Mce/MlaD domain-containing protein n=1 Tax=Paraconexibacter sp. AEG42_29 TaxID=2997339 RepID=A0AAU7B0A5_9ACTN
MQAPALGRQRLIGLATIVLSLGLIIAIFTGAPGKILGGDGREVVVNFRSAAQVIPGAPVRIDGVKVGAVKSIDAQADGKSARVTLKLDSSADELYGDARAALRWRTVLGSAFYVALIPGHPSAGELGDAAIPPSRTTTQVELDDITSVLQGGARAGLKRLPGEVAAALSDPAVPSAAFDALADVAPQTGRAFRSLRGERRGGADLRALVDNTSRTVDALGADPSRLRALIEGAASTLSTTASREAAIRTTLRRAPSTLVDTNVTLDRLRTTLGVVDPLVDRLERSVGQLQPTLSRVRTVALKADTLLMDARPLLRDLRPAVRSVALLAQSGKPLLDGLTPSVSRVDRTIIPAFARKWPETGISTTVMTGAALAGLAGIAGQKDINGHFVRFPLTSGSGSAYLPCQAFPNNPDFSPAQQLQCESVDDVLGQLFNPPASRKTRAKEGRP